MVVTTTPSKQRLDIEMVDRGLADSRSRARALIMAGDVLVNGAVEPHAGTPVRSSDEIAMREKPRFVSRGGDKLAHALEEFGVSPEGLVCADLGASTGGFTDCLLQGGATRVYAVDVGYGQLDQRMRDDPRVVVMERINARHLDALPEPIDLVVIDVSFISLSLILPVARKLLRDGGHCVPLIKPQFEAGRGEVGKGGVVRDPAIHRRVIENVLRSATESGFGLAGLTRSPLLGPAGNVEFLAAFVAGGPSIELEPILTEVVNPS